MAEQHKVFVMSEQYRNRSGNTQFILCDNGNNIFHFAISSKNLITITGQPNIRVYERGNIDNLANTAEQLDSTLEKEASSRIRTYVEEINTTSINTRSVLSGIRSRDV